MRSGRPACQAARVMTQTALECATASGGSERVSSVDPDIVSAVLGAPAGSVAVHFALIAGCVASWCIAFAERCTTHRQLRQARRSRTAWCASSGVRSPPSRPSCISSARRTSRSASCGVCVATRSARSGGGLRPPRRVGPRRGGRELPHLSGDRRAALDCGVSSVIACGGAQPRLTDPSATPSPASRRSTRRRAAA
jgi:hypothetical protein